MQAGTETDIGGTLGTVFGFDHFREGQREIIEKILEGKSALAVFPTGSGKSLCYQLPALHLPGLTLVISPLIALMKDQIDFLRKRGVSAARLDSSVGIEAIRETDAALRDGTLKLLYVAPERFSNERFIGKLRRLPIDLMVIDEAHCISEWGHNFRPDYLKLARMARSLEVGRVLALTATATPPVAEDICREFEIGKDAFVHTGFHRPNLVLRAAACHSTGKPALLLERLRARPRGPTIVYVTLQRTAETVAGQLAAQGFPARAYHAGMNPEDRDAVQDWFMQSADAIVVATIAFGMGIDKADIRHVYHYNLPKSLENYSQEIGRAGRDGLESTCEIFAAPEDVTVLENFTYGDTPEQEAIEALVDSIFKREAEFDVSVYELSGAYDIRPLVVSTLLTYLELAGVIEATAPFYSEYWFQPLKPSAEILGKFDERRQSFLRGLFKIATKGKIWFSVDLDQAVETLGAPRHKIVAAFNYLEEQGDVILKVAGVRQGYRRLECPLEANKLKQSLIERFETRERNDIARVQAVASLAQSDGCIVRALLAHFGESLPTDCGHCGRCLGDKPAGPLERDNRQDVPIDAAGLAALRAGHPEALGSPRRLARFLCGLTSPRLTKSKLTKHPLFGSLEKAPFASVLQAVDS